MKRIILISYFSLISFLVARAQETLDFEPFYENGLWLYNWGEGIDPYYYAESYIHEAENMNFEGASVDTIHSGYSGSGYVDGFYHLQSAYVEYKDFFFWTEKVRIGIVSTGERPCEIIHNGIVIDTLMFTGSNTWTDWKFTSFPIIFSTGLNTVRLQPITSEGLPNVDKFIIGFDAKFNWDIISNTSLVCSKNYTAGSSSFENNGEIGRLAIGFNLENDQPVYTYFSAIVQSPDAFLEYRMNGVALMLDDILSEDLDSNVYEYSFPMQRGFNLIEIVAKGVDIRSWNVSAQGLTPVSLNCYPNSYILYEEPATYDPERIDMPLCLVNSTRRWDIHTGYDNFYYIDIDYGYNKGFDFRVYLDEPANLQVQVRYAGPDRPARVLVDGQVRLPRVEFPDTESWENWDSILVYLSLEKGDHYIRFESIERNGLGNIDHVKVFSDVPVFGVMCHLFDGEVNSIKLEKGESSCVNVQHEYLINVEYSNYASTPQFLDVDFGATSYRLWDLAPHTYKGNRCQMRFQYYHEPPFFSVPTWASDSVEIHNITIVGENISETDCYSGSALKSAEMMLSNNMGSYANGISLSPNPAKGFTYLSVKGEPNNTVLVSIINSVGHIVFSEEFNTDAESIPLNLINLATGMYSVVVRCEIGTYSEKLIVE